MKIAKGFEVLDIPMFHTSNIVHPVLLWDKNDVMLVDTGYPGSLKAIKESFLKRKVPFQKLNHIIITHQDIDHIGSLSGIVQQAPQKIEVICHKEEKPYIEFEKTPIKFTPETMIRFQSLAEMLPVGEKEEVLQSIDHLACPIDRVVEQNEILPYFGGIQVIHTPGHTPGHMCLYLVKYKALITGDILNIVKEELSGPNPQFTPDMKLAMESLNRLDNFEVKTVISYHGGVYQKPFKQALSALKNVSD